MAADRKTGDPDSSTNLKSLIDLVETAVSENSIGNRYQDLLQKTLRMGFSSYTLNVLILAARKGRLEKTAEKTDPEKEDPVSPFVFRQIKPRIEVREVKTPVPRERKGRWILHAMFVILLATLLLLALQYRQALSRNADSRDKLDRIGRIIETSSAHTSLGSWTSTNTSHNSESHQDYPINVSEGDILCFRYDISSENYDILFVEICDDRDTTTILFKWGDEQGYYIWRFEDSADVTVRFRYKKDETISEGEDRVKISDISIIRPLAFQTEIDRMAEILGLELDSRLPSDQSDIQSDNTMPIQSDNKRPTRKSSDSKTAAHDRRGNHRGTVLE